MDKSDSRSGDVMKKRLKELDGYVINNPFYITETPKYIFMKNAHLVYRKMRTRLAYFFPLSEMQKALWEMTTFLLI